jgi:ParB family chromosome partitioning protein
MARHALGKGLSALIRDPEATAAATPTPPAPAPEPQAGPAASTAGTGLQQVDIDVIDPSPYQPRTQFREEALEELARSIRTSGIIQPLVVRSIGVRYELIAGERRWRAAQRAGLARVPVVLRQVPEEMALELTLVENIQREDLNAIEQARAFERLMEEFNLTQEDVADRTGKDRATVANAVRLLKLERNIQEMIEDGRLSAGHGRALLAFADPKLRQALAQKAAKGALTVRQLEKIASRRPRSAKAVEQLLADPNLREAIEELQRTLGTRVQLRPPKGKRPGQLIVEYYDEAQLVGLYDRLSKA